MSARNRANAAHRAIHAEITAAHEAAKVAGAGWEARAFDALTLAGATAKPATF